MSDQTGGGSSRIGPLEWPAEAKEAWVDEAPEPPRSRGADGSGPGATPDGQEAAQADGATGRLATLQARWGSSRLLLYAAGFLLLAAFLFDLIGLVSEAAAYSSALGLLVGAVAVFAGVLVLKLSVDEFRAFRRLDRIDALRARGQRLLASQDAQGNGSAFVAAIRALYRERTDIETALSNLDQSIADYHNDQEVVGFVQGGILAPLDGRAYRLVLARARDTMVITTLSPSPMLDALLVLWQNLKLVRGVAALYGARPGYLGGVRLLKRMVASLAVAGLSESAQHLAAAALGGGLAAAVSTRVGQGLVNGLLTARIGLAAMSLCRPLPFPAGEEPSMGRIRAELLSVPKRLL